MSRGMLAVLTWAILVGGVRAQQVPAALPGTSTGVGGSGGATGTPGSDPFATAAQAHDADSYGATTAKTADKKPKYEVATFGGGCFWHVEAVFDRMKGVKEAVSGYSGGSVPYPSYEMVHTGMTGHAEVVRVVYDPKIVSYEDLLKAFWSCHDPTQLNRQGPDEGPQYRSVIFYHSKAQRDAALESYRKLTKAQVFSGPIVTQLLPAQPFYRAEDYHQDYYGGKPRPYSPTRHSRVQSKTVSSRGVARKKATRSASSVSTPTAPSAGSSTGPAGSSSPSGKRHE